MRLSRGFWDCATHRPLSTSFLWFIYVESYKVIPKRNYLYSGLWLSRRAASEADAEAWSTHCAQAAGAVHASLEALGASRLRRAQQGAWPNLVVKASLRVQGFEAAGGRI